MRINTPTRTAKLAIVFLGCACFALLLPFAPHAEMKAALRRSVPGTAFLRKPAAQTGLPVRLRIPSIQVNAAIESVGLTTKRAMDVPSHPDNVGWYNLGSRPGEIGSAVLAGHLDWYNGKTAVFQHLDRLRKGDTLSVETDNGRFLLFVVREIRTYQPTEYAPEVFQKSDGRHLNLVTCGGTWDSARKMYSKRRVIFTDAIEKL